MSKESEAKKDFLEEAIKLLYGSSAQGYALVVIAQELRLIRQQIGTFLKLKDKETEKEIEDFWTEAKIQAEKKVEFELKEKSNKWEQLEFNWEKK